MWKSDSRNGSEISSFIRGDRGLLPLVVTESGPSPLRRKASAGCWLDLWREHSYPATNAQFWCLCLKCPVSPCCFVRLSRPLFSLCIFLKVSHLQTFMLRGVPLTKPVSTASTCLSYCLFHALLRTCYWIYIGIMYIRSDMFVSKIVFVFPLFILFVFSLSSLPLSPLSLLVGRVLLKVSSG